MSDRPQGEGWWLASDDRWYPPESRSAPAAPPGPMGDEERVGERGRSRWSTGKKLGVTALIGIPVLIMGFVVFSDGTDQLEEINNVFEGSVATLSTTLGERIDGSSWHSISEGLCRRHAEWWADTEQALRAVDQVEEVVLRERGKRVFPSSEEAEASGDLRTHVWGVESWTFSTWLDARLDDDGRFRLVVYGDEC